MDRAQAVSGNGSEQQKGRPGTRKVRSGPRKRRSRNCGGARRRGMGTRASKPGSAACTGADRSAARGPGRKNPQELHCRMKSLLIT